MAITPLPTPPTRQDPVNFADRADTFLAALPSFAVEVNTDLNIVNSNMTHIQTVSNNISDVNAVVSNLSTINSVSADIADVVAVANNEPNIDTVAANIANVNTVVSNLSTINSVSTNIVDIVAVANNETNIDAVAGSLSNIDTVVNNLSTINDVGTDIADIVAVANNEANIDIVANNISNINAALADLPALSAKVSKTGDTMTGPLSVPAGATGTEVPQRNEVVGISGNETINGQKTFTSNVTATAEFSAGNGNAGEKRFRLKNAARDAFFYLNDTGAIGLWDVNGSFSRWGTDNTGNFTAAGNITAYSDIRLKTDLTKIADAVEKVKSLTGYTYTRIDSGERHTGLIAQDVQKVMPEAVMESDGHLSVAYGSLMGLMVEAIKELNDRIEKLEGR